MVDNANSRINSPSYSNSLNSQETPASQSPSNRQTEASSIFASSVRTDARDNARDLRSLVGIEAVALRDSTYIDSPLIDVDSKRPRQDKGTINEALAVLESIASGMSGDWGTVEDWQERHLSKDNSILPHMSTKQLLHFLALEMQLGKRANFQVDRHKSMRPFSLYKALLNSKFTKVFDVLGLHRDSITVNALAPEAIHIYALKAIAKREHWHPSELPVALAHYINSQKVKMVELFKCCEHTAILSELDLHNAATHLRHLDFEGVDSKHLTLVQSILSACSPNLGLLNIRGVQFLKELAPLPKCISLDISESSIHSLPEHLPECKTFKFSHCSQVQGPAPSLPLCKTFEFDDATIRSLDSSFQDNRIVYDENMKKNRTFLREQTEYLKATLPPHFLMSIPVLKEWEEEHGQRILEAIPTMANPELFEFLSLIRHLDMQLSGKFLKTLMNRLPQAGGDLLALIRIGGRTPNVILEKNWSHACKSLAIAAYINGTLYPMEEVFESNELLSLLKEIAPKIVNLNFSEINDIHKETAWKLLMQQHKEVINLDIANSSVFTALPPLPKCKELDISQTGIVQLPDCPELLELYCTETALESIPEMNKLKYLGCDDIKEISQLPSFPELLCLSAPDCIRLERIGALPKCIEFDIENCWTLDLANIPTMPHCSEFISQGSNVQLPQWEIDPVELDKNPLGSLIHLGENHLSKGFPLPEVVFVENLHSANARTLDGEDAGGLLRSVLSKIGKWVYQNMEQLLDGSLAGISSAERIIALQTIGKLMTICHISRNSTGKLFCDQDFKVVYEMIRGNKLRASAAWASDCPQVADLVSCNSADIESRFGEEKNTLIKACSILESSFEGEINDLYEDPIRVLLRPGHLENIKHSLEDDWKTMPFISFQTIAQAVVDSMPTHGWRELIQEGSSKMQLKIEGFPVSVENLHQHMDLRAHPSVSTRSFQMTLGFLGNWISRASPEALMAFVEFSTGSRSLSNHNITIELTDEPPENLPISHTCAYTIELSANYPNQEIFDQKLNMALREGMSFEAI